LVLRQEVCQNNNVQPKTLGDQKGLVGLKKAPTGLKKGVKKSKSDFCHCTAINNDRNLQQNLFHLESTGSKLFK
jgi:hypothetical protein